MLFKNKKGEVVSIIILILLVIIIVGYGIKISGRECSSNVDCKENQYCGSDFKCHNFKIIKVYRYDLIIPAIIVAKGFIIGAWIIRKKRIKAEAQHEYQPENPYYK